MLERPHGERRSHDHGRGVLSREPGKMSPDLPQKLSHESFVQAIKDPKEGNEELKITFER